MEFQHFTTSRRRFVLREFGPEAWVASGNRVIGFKPPPEHVLWLSVGDAWRRFSKDIWPQKRLYGHTVTVPRSRLIIVRTAAQAEALTERYGHRVNGAKTALDWARLVRDHPKKWGMLVDVDAIRPPAVPMTVWHQRLSWLSVWDVPSAVLWAVRSPLAGGRYAADLPATGSGQRSAGRAPA